MSACPYLWMLGGDDQHIKSDRMVMRWLSNHLRRDVRVPEARALVRQGAHHLGQTPWELDHAICTSNQADHER